ncbi:MAG: ABC transporter ATP-binding protein [Bacillota bacterium]
MLKNSRQFLLWKVIIKTFRYAWLATPQTLMLFLTISLVHGFEQVLEIYGMQLVFDAVAGFASGKLMIGKVWLFIGIFGAIALLLQLTDAARWLVQGHLYRRTGCLLQSLIHKKIAIFELVKFEMSDTFDRIQKAVRGSQEAPSACRGVLEIATYYLPFFLFAAGYLFLIKPLLAIALLLIFIPVFVGEVVRANAAYALVGETANLQRRFAHYEDCVAAREYLRETRTRGAYGFFSSLFINCVDQYSATIWKTEKRLTAIEIALSSINIAGYICVLLLLVKYLLDGSITVGMFAAVFYSIAKVNSLSWQLITLLGTIVRDVSLGAYLYEFLQLKESDGLTEKFNTGCEIKLNNISFKYPGAENLVLTDINLTITPGEVVAIVGGNGAGKTTLTKIISGLYRPLVGKVTFGNKDAAKYKTNCLCDSISAVFQQFQRYQMELADNVRISDCDSEVDAVQALDKAGIQPDKKVFPEGINTMLSREFGGVDLSGGQWQRVAIARGLYREHDLIVLDEPTSAIDPLEETRLFRKFIEIVRGKTAILVTHRLGSAKIANRIIVMAHGRIVETGNHDELMALSGLYREMFTAQAKWYER